MPNPFWKTDKFKQLVTQRKQSTSSFQSLVQSSSGSAPVQQPKIESAPVRNPYQPKGVSADTVNQMMAKRQQAFQPVTTPQPSVPVVGQASPSSYLVNRGVTKRPPEPEVTGIDVESQKINRYEKPKYIENKFLSLTERPQVDYGKRVQEEQPYRMFVRGAEITPETLIDRPEMASSYISNLQEDLVRRTENAPDVFKQYVPPAFSAEVNIGDRLYWDNNTGVIVGYETDTPLFINEENGYEFLDFVGDREAKFDVGLAQNIGNQYLALVQTFENEKVRQSEGIMETPYVTASLLEQNITAPFLGSTGDEAIPTTFYYKDQNGEAQPFSFRTLKGLETLRFGEEAVRRQLGAAYNGKFVVDSNNPYFSDEYQEQLAENAKGVAAVVGSTVQLLGKGAKALWKSIFSGGKSQGQFLNYLEIAKPELYKKEYIEKAYRDREEAREPSILEQTGLTVEQLEQSQKNLIDFIEASDVEILTREEYQAMETHNLNRAAGLFNGAFSTPLVSSDNYQKASNMIIEAEKLLNEVSGAKGVNWSYDLSVNPEKEDLYYATLASLTLQKGSPLENWERMQVRDQITDVTTEIVGGLVLDYLNLLDLGVGSWIDNVSDMKFAGNILSKQGDIYKGLSTLGEVKDLNLGSLIFKGVFGTMSDFITDPITAGLAAHFAERNHNYRHAWSLSYSQITSMLHDDTANIVNKALGGADGVIRSAEDLDDLILTGRLVVGLQAEGKSFDEIVALLGNKDATNVPALFRTEDRIASIIRMVNVKSPAKSNSVVGEWRRLFNNAYATAWQAKTDKLKNAYFPLLDIDNLVAKESGDVKFDEFVTELFEQAKNVPEETREIYIVQEVSDYLGRMAEQTLSADEYAMSIGEHFAGIYESEHAVAQYAGTKIMEDTLLGWSLSKLDNQSVSQAFATASHVHKTLMNRWVNTILSKNPSFAWMNVSENMVQIAASSGKGGLVKAADFLLDTPKIAEILPDMPLQARKGFYSLLGVVDSEDVVALRKMILDNPEIALPTAATKLTFFQDAMKKGKAKWLERMIEKGGLTETMSKEMLLTTLAKDNSLFAIQTIGEGDKARKVITVAGKPVRNPLAALWAGNNSLAKAGRSASSMNELVARVFLANDTYTKHFDTVSHLLDRVLNGTREALMAQGATDDVIEEALARIRNGWDIAHGDSVKFIERTLQDALTQAGLRSDIPIPPSLRQIASGMDEITTQRFLFDTRDKLNDFFTARKLESNLPPTEDEVVEFFNNIVTEQLEEINATLNSGGEIAYLIFGDKTGRMMPVSPDTEKFLNELKAAGNDVSKTSFADNVASILEENGVDTVDELLDRVTTMGAVAFKKPTEEVILQAMEESVPYRSLFSIYGDKMKFSGESDEFRALAKLAETISEDEAADVTRQGIIARIKEKWHEMYPDKPLNEAYAKYGYARAAINKSVLLPLKQAYMADPLSDLGRAYVGFLEYDRHIEGMFRLIRDSIIPFVDPGRKWMKGKGSGAARKAAADLANATIDNLLSKAADNLDSMRMAAFTGNDFVMPSMREMMGWAGYKLEFNDAGRPIRLVKDSFLYEQPIFYYPGEDMFEIFVTGGNASEIAQGVGIRNIDIWNAPINSSRDELMAMAEANNITQASKVKNTPFVQKHGTQVPTERHEELRSEWFKAFIQTKIKGENTLEFYLKPFFAGDDVRNFTPDAVVTRIREVANSMQDDFVRYSMNDLASYIEESDAYFIERWLAGNKEARPVISLSNVPEDMRAWAGHKIEKSAQAQGVQNLIAAWQDEIIDQLKNGGRFYPDGMLDDANKAIVNEAVEKASVELAKMEDALWNGGVVEGITLEGAIPHMKKRLRIPTETTIDKAMKGIVPFWNYNTRGSAAFLRSVIDHPEVLGWYRKYLYFSRGKAIEAGLTSSNGQPLPSTAGKVPLININGQNVWINPLAAFPFLRYYFSNQYTTDYEEDNPEFGDFWKMLRLATGATAAYGFRLNPILSFFLISPMGQDKYTTQSMGQRLISTGMQTGLGIPQQLIPWFVWDGIDNMIRKAPGSLLAGDDTETARPQVQWFDPLVEQHIIEEYYNKIIDTNDPEKQMNLAMELQRLIMKRENSPEYASHVDAVRRSEYFRNLSGFFTGMYPKVYSDAYIEISNIRDHNNAMKRAINDLVAAQIFMPDTATAEQRRDLYIDDRFGGATGALFSLKNNLSWVTNPTTGELLEESSPRRAEVDRLITANMETTQMFEEIGNAISKLNRDMSVVPIGLEYKDPRGIEARETFWNEMNRIYADYAHIDSDWTVGSKTQLQTEQHFLDMWWKDMNRTRPVREDGEKWDAYQVRVQNWENNLPTLATELYPLFSQRVLSIWSVQDYTEGQDINKVLEVIQENNNAETYNQWEKSNDNVMDAALRAWEEIYWNPYHEAMKDLSGAQKEIAEIQWLKQNPVPTAQDIVAWISEQEEYIGKWDAEDIENAVMTKEEREAKYRQIASIEEAQTAGKTEAELQTSNLFDMLWWRSPKDKDFYATFNVHAATLGIEESDLDAFYDYGEVMADMYPEKAAALEEALALTYDELGITKPTGTILQERAEVQRLNDQFNSMMTMQFGEGWEEQVFSVSSLSKYERNLLKERNPDQYAMWQAYYDLRDTFGEQNPLWAEYYQSKGKSSGGTRYYGYSGGGGSRRSGGASTVATPESFTMMAAGTRSTMNANELLDPENLGKGKVAGMPKLPTAFWENTTIDLREEIYRYVNGELPLSEAAINYLLRVIERYPEYESEVNELIGNTEPEGEPATP